MGKLHCELLNEIHFILPQKAGVIKLYMAVYTLSSAMFHGILYLALNFDPIAHYMNTFSYWHSKIYCPLAAFDHAPKTIKFLPKIADWCLYMQWPANLTWHVLYVKSWSQQIRANCRVPARRGLQRTALAPGRDETQAVNPLVSHVKP